MKVLLAYIPLIVILASSHDVSAKAWYDSSNLEVWPTHVRMTIYDLVDGDEYRINFERANGEDIWRGWWQYGEAYSVQWDESAGEHRMYVNGNPKFLCGERWWVIGSWEYLLSGNNHLWQVDEYWVDWGRVDVVWIPVTHGFFLGFLVDVLVGCNRLLLYPFVGLFQGSLRRISR